jgi:hypothetical protein
MSGESPATSERRVIGEPLRQFQPMRRSEGTSNGKAGRVQGPARRDQGAPGRDQLPSGGDQLSSEGVRVRCTTIRENFGTDSIARGSDQLPLGGDPLPSRKRPRPLYEDPGDFGTDQIAPDADPRASAPRSARSGSVNEALSGSARNIVCRGRSTSTSQATSQVCDSTKSIRISRSVCCAARGRKVCPAPSTTSCWTKSRTLARRSAGCACR